MKKLSDYYGDMYTVRNLVVSGTHTHSGSGGFSQYLLYDITALGFNKQGFEALVAGIVHVRYLGGFSTIPLQLDDLINCFIFLMIMPKAS